MWHENDKELSSISYSGATKVYKRLPQHNMWHNLLRCINSCCHNTKMWHDYEKNSILFSIHVPQIKTKKDITIFIFYVPEINVNVQHWLWH